MTRTQLITNLASHFPNLTAEDAEVSVLLILGAIKNAMIKDGRVEIRGFGSFSLNHKHPRMGRNPKTGEKINIPAKRVPYFKPGKELKERVDACLQPSRAVTGNLRGRPCSIPTQHSVQL